MLACRVWTLRAATILLLAAGSIACSTETDPAPERRRLDVVDVLGGEQTDGFERALEPILFAFPSDLGAHPRFAAEWWYFTGNLDADDGRRFGYQLTFFRTSLRPPALLEERPSSWATDQVWMAHFALTDAAGGTFSAFERFQRGSLGLAGAQSAPWRVWLDDWSLEQTGPTSFPVRLRAHGGPAASRPATTPGDAGVAIDLIVEPDKPIVLQGDRGLSQKGPTPGNASYYYSFTRLRTRGTVRVSGEELPVTGASWLDREWSTSVLEAGQVGWDWFALQLDDGRDLVYYQLRETDGQASAESAGTLVLADGSAIRLDPGSVALEIEDTWTSPLDGTRYPARWTLSLSELGLRLGVTPVFAAQELDLAFRYWEGAVDVSGTGPDGDPIRGHGYVELTGYAGGGSHP